MPKGEVKKGGGSECHQSEKGGGGHKSQVVTTRDMDGRQRPGLMKKENLEEDEAARKAPGLNATHGSHSGFPQAYAGIKTQRWVSILCVTKTQPRK